MRLRIVHQLSLLLAAGALLSAAAVGGVVAWNLRAGFSDYLRSRDAQQLERFAEVVAQRAHLLPADGSRLPMRELMDEFLHREGLAPPPGWRPEGEGRRPRPGPPPPPGPVGDGRAPDGGARPPRDAPPPQQGGLPRPGPDSVTQRIQVLDPQGRRLGGPEFPPGRGLLQRPVQADGRLIAYVRMLPSSELEGVDARFLRRQYLGLAFAAAGSLALALLGAWLAARWLGSPLARVQAATRRIAGGELDVVLPESGSREMAELIVDVNRMASSLKRLEGARRRWIAQISHELRTPLSVLLGELEAIQDGARQPTAPVVSGLRDEVLQLARLVADLHTLSMADLGALPCEFSDGRAAAWLNRAAERFRPRALQAGLAFEVADGGDAAVRWDFGRIEQLLANLLDNSLRYTATPGRVRLQWSVEGNWLRLAVDDSAPGVALGQMEQLFEPLFRADTARQRKGQGGSGLGLSICRAIVQAHGGTLRAAASPLGGLRVEAKLPLLAGERP